MTTQIWRRPLFGQRIGRWVWLLAALGIGAVVVFYALISVSLGEAARMQILIASVIFAALFTAAAAWVDVTLRAQIKKIQDTNDSLDIAIRRENQISNSLRGSEAEARELSVAAARSEQTLNQFFDDAPVGIFWINSEGKMLRANAAAQRLIGETDLQKCLDGSVIGFFSFPQRYHALMGRLQQGETVIGFEARIKQANGKVIQVIMDANVHWEGSNFMHARVFARDITELKQAEHDRKMMEIQLRQAQKLESIGQLAAGIAHEINTPTQYIGDNVRFLKDSFKDVLAICEVAKDLAKSNDHKDQLRALEIFETADLEYLRTEIPSAIEQSLEGVTRVAEIVRAMKDFSHPGRTEKTNIDVNRAIESTLTVARNEWKYVADVELNLDRNLPPLRCLPGEFNQVLLNIIVNAAHAIEDVVGDGSKGKGRIGITSKLAGSSVEIRISDSGTGIPESVRHRIFEPFFTTKDVGKGTGQGLAITRSVVVEKHEGKIFFETEMGRGTTFVIQIPLGVAPKLRSAFSTCEMAAIKD